MRNLILIGTSGALAIVLLAASGCQTTTVGPGGMVTGLSVPMPPQPVPVASAARVRTAQAARAAKKEELDDPCATRLQNIITSLYLYFAANQRLPDKLDDLRAVTGVESQLDFTCPVSGKPYVYNPNGLQAQDGDASHLILYDPTPAHNGRRWGVVRAATPNRTGQVFYQMDVVQLTEPVFNSFKPVPAPLTEPAPQVTAEPQVPSPGAETPGGQQ